MERRKQFRSRTEIFTALRLFDPDRTVYAQVIDYSAEGVGLRTAEALPAEAAVVLDYKGVLLLGEVVFCAPSLDGWFRAGLRCEQVFASSASALTTQAAVAELAGQFQQ